MRFLNKLFHIHIPYTFVSNIFGDPINLLNARSIWKCHCGRFVFKKELNHDDPSMSFAYRINIPSSILK